jgi:hypothetical protein
MLGWTFAESEISVTGEVNDNLIKLELKHGNSDRNQGDRAR